MTGEVDKVAVEEMQVIERLRPQWAEIIRELGYNEHANETFTEIIHRYGAGDGRAYHNLFHIDRMLSFVANFDYLAKNKHALKAAIFGHDIVYVPASQTNEQESADVFEKILKKLSVNEENTEEAKRLIMITKEHKTTDGDIDGKLIIDGDYEILASADNVYDDYARNIRRENVGSGRVSEEAFKKGRKHFINGWLDLIRKDGLFLIPEIREKLQVQAKRSLEREFLHLK